MDAKVSLLVDRPTSTQRKYILLPLDSCSPFEVTTWLFSLTFYQPQRPLRSLRPRNDENMPPDGLMTKTIHQRNKSSPALSMAASGLIKAGTKRTAFGDVSNIAPVGRPSKDDSILPQKVGLQPSVKQVQPTADKKTAAFNRPAQRPMSVQNLKSLLTGGHYNSQQEVNAKSQIVENGSQSQSSNIRKVLTKRATTVFKDAPLDSVPEIEAPVKSNSTDTNYEEFTLPPILEPSLESRLYLPPPATDKSLPSEPTKEPTHPPSEASLPGIESVTLEPEALPKPVENEGADTDPTKHFSCADLPPQPTENVLPPYLSTISEENNAAAPTHELPKVPTLPPALPAIEPHQMYQPMRPEPEEYWEEEEDEIPDEEGYVTARSFRSKGENTTGGLTTVIFPQMNQRARREISAAKTLVETTRTPEDIEDETFDTSMVAEYGDEIFDYMRQLEVKMLPNAHYMDNQHELQWPMRSVLMEWLVQVHHRFTLLPETLFLCVNYIDRFLSCKVVSLGKLQLVGATAIFIAAKYEEINCPSVQEIVYMVDNGYSTDEILKAERFMLTMLQFELGWPGPMSFLRRISKADDYDLETRTLAKYFLEVTLMDERFIGSPPSFIAAASHCLSRLMLRKGNWVSTLMVCLDFC